MQPRTSSGANIKYNLLPVVVLHNGITIKSSDPTQLVHITVSHNTFDLKQNVGRCTFAKFLGDNVTVENLLVEVPQDCFDGDIMQQDLFFHGTAFTFLGKNSAMTNIQVSGAAFFFYIRLKDTLGLTKFTNISIYNQKKGILSCSSCWIGHIDASGGVFSSSSVNLSCVLTFQRRQAIDFTHSSFSTIDTSAVFSDGVTAVTNTNTRTSNTISYKYIIAMVFIGLAAFFMLAFIVSKEISSVSSDSKVTHALHKVMYTPKGQKVTDHFPSLKKKKNN